MDLPIPTDSIRSDVSTKDEAFQLLSDGIRLEVLTALGETLDPGGTSPMRFSELRRRVGVDDPGQLNYHLDKLTTHFVRHTEDGYELREAGKRIVRLLLSGTALDDPGVGPAPVDARCWYCDGETQLRYSDGWWSLECTDCNARCVDTIPAGVISRNEFPPSGLLDRSPNEINEANRIWGAHRRASVMDGVCPECAGHMPVTSIDVCDDHHPDRDTDRYCEACGSLFRIRVSHVCAVCRYGWKLPALFYPSRHPAVTAFYHDHGIAFDLAANEQRDLLLTFREEVTSRDPFRLCITVPVDGDRLHLTYDADMDVVEVAGTEAAPSAA